jgi:Ca2+-binding RTX toxin-like protein
MRHFEQLERRRVLAVPYFVVTGTPGDDVIVIREQFVALRDDYPDSLSNFWILDRNQSSPTSIEASGPKADSYLYVEAGGGNDTIILEVATGDFIVHAGGGDDTVIISKTTGQFGGTRNDAPRNITSPLGIYGGPGANTLKVPQGNSRVLTPPSERGPVAVKIEPNPTTPGHQLTLILNSFHSPSILESKTQFFAFDRLETSDTADDIKLRATKKSSIPNSLDPGELIYVDARGGDDLIDISLSVGTTIRGGDGRDTIIGGSGNDLLIGGSGSDSIKGEGGNDTIQGEGGNDRLFGGTGNDSILAGAGNDTLWGNDGSDLLNGGSGDDLFEAGDSIRDTILGGAGVNRARVDTGLDQVERVQQILA